MPSTSGSSEEIISTARPLLASSEISRWTSDLAPTSMPRVGSSMISSFGSVASHFASTTFCWLPPDSVPTVSSRRWYFSCRRVAHSLASARSLAARMIPAGASWRMRVIVALRATERSITSPCWRRSSGTKPMPARIAAVGLAFGSRLPFSSTRPPSALSIPKIARATSERPAPTSPERATISPALTSKETSKKTPSRVSRSTLRTGLPISEATFGKSVSRSRPTIMRTRSSFVRPFSSPLNVTAPSRMTVTWSQIAKISSRRWEMNMTAAPCSLSVRVTRKRRSTSVPESAAVGSSMISTRALNDSALAISTSCWSAIERPRTGRSGSIATPSCLNSSAVRSLSALRSMRWAAASGWRPMKTFSATVRSGKSVGSW